MYWFLETHSSAYFVNSYVHGFGKQAYVWRRGSNPSHAYWEENQSVVTAMHRRLSLKSVGGFGARDHGLEDW